MPWVHDKNRHDMCHDVNAYLMRFQVIVGSFLWGGGSKTKSKKVEVPEEARDPDHQTEENPVTPTSVQPSQNLTPTSSMGVWPGSRSVDIDLMRG